MFIISGGIIPINRKWGGVIIQGELERRREQDR
jgi:hypothetical protein